EALAAIDQEQPDLVLTDLQMPGMDGLQLVEAVRAGHPSVPVVLMTGFGSEEVAVQALRRGAASYVPKRRLVGELAEILEQVLAAARADQDQQRLAERLTHLEAHYVLDNDPSLVRALVARLRRDLADLRLGDEGSRLCTCIALEEALANAVYHGNLE